MRPDSSFHSARLDDVRSAVRKASVAAGRLPDAVRLLVASKTQPASHIEPLLEAGQLLFGENRVQEAVAKWPALTAAHAGVELHLIGPLQSNKADAAIRLFDVIQTLDRPSLALALARSMTRQNRHPKLFIEVNIGSEPQKAGILPDMTRDFLRRCTDEYGLSVSGLMCIPPQDDAPAPWFLAMRKLADLCKLAELSMGMSGDFKAAIMSGATIVRVGTAIFGARP